MVLIFFFGEIVVALCLFNSEASIKANKLKWKSFGWSECSAWFSREKQQQLNWVRHENQLLLRFHLKSLIQISIVSYSWIMTTIIVPWEPSDVLAKWLFKNAYTFKMLTSRQLMKINVLKSRDSLSLRARTQSAQLWNVWLDEMNTALNNLQWDCFNWNPFDLLISVASNDQLKGNIFMLCFCFLNASTWKIVRSFLHSHRWHIQSINHSHFERTNTTIFRYTYRTIEQMN